MSNLTASIYMDWGSPLRIFTGTIEPQAEQDSLNVPFFVSVRDFAVNVGSSTIKRWGSNTMPCPGSIKISNNILTNKQEPHYRCTAVPFTEIRKLTNNTDMHPRNKDRANAIIKWLEPIYKKYAEAILKPIETGTTALTPKFSEIVSQESGMAATIEPIEITVAGISDNEQKKAEYRKLRESGMTASEALSEVLGKPNQRQCDACEAIAPVGPTRIHESDIQDWTPQTKSNYRALLDSGMAPSEALTELLGDQFEPVSVKAGTSESPIEPIAFTVDDVAKRLYELKQENESLKAEVEKLKKDLEDYRTIRGMFLSIGGD